MTLRGGRRDAPNGGSARMHQDLEVAQKVTSAGAAIGIRRYVTRGGTVTDEAGRPGRLGGAQKRFAGGCAQRVVFPCAGIIRGQAITSPNAAALPAQDRRRTLSSAARWALARAAARGRAAGVWRYR